MENNNAMITMSDIEKMGAAIAKSGLFGVKDTTQAVALMLIAQAEGLHPAIACRDYHIINGKPSLKADAMLSRFQGAGGKISWVEYNDKVVSANFTHPQGGGVLIAWSIDMAKQAGLMTNAVWSKYPRQMLKSRVISEGIRAVFPGLIVGSYTPEEIADLDIQKNTNVDPVITEITVVSPQQNENSNLISDAQRKRLFAISHAAGKSEDEMKEILSQYSFKSSKEITKNYYEEICKKAESKSIDRQPGDEDDGMQAAFDNAGK